MLPALQLPTPLLAEDDARLWFWGAVAIVLFIRWIWNNAVASRRRRMGDDLEEPLEEEYEDPATYQEHYPEQQPHSQGQAAPPPLPQSQQQAQPADELRQFLEQLAGVPQKQTPPPPPVVKRQPKPEKPKAPELTKEEKDALERLKNRQKQQPKKRRRVAGGPLSLRDSLRDPQSLKNAIVLKEILDKPKSLQDEAQPM